MMIKINKSNCTGCRICEVICSLQHFKVINNERSRVRVKTQWPWEDEPSLCRQCKKPKCVEACKTGALTMYNPNPLLKSELCTQCHACIDACPFQAVQTDPETNLPMLCDTCDGQYMCTKWCPNKVIEVIG